MRMFACLGILVTLAFAHLPAGAQSELIDGVERGPDERELFQRYIDTLTAGTGIWVASNSQYQTEEEPFDAYKIAWRKGIGGRSAYGRMTALRGVDETDPIWEIRVYWHAGDNQARIMQFGNSGIFTDGPLRITRDGPEETVESVQTFYPPRGEAYRVRHVTELDEYVQHVESFQESEDGWDPRRSYDWHRRRVVAPD